MFDKDPCLTCYAEDSIHRRKEGLPYRSAQDYAKIFHAPYICDTGGYSICENHLPYAMVAGWNPRRKTDIAATLSTDEKTT